MIGGGELREGVAGLMSGCDDAGKITGCWCERLGVAVRAGLGLW
jgi:hypothetical protein